MEKDAEDGSNDLFGSTDFRLFEDDNDMDIAAFLGDPNATWSPASFSLDELDKLPDYNNNNNNNSNHNSSVNDSSYFPPSVVDTSGWERPPERPPSTFTRRNSIDLGAASPNFDLGDYPLEMDPYLTNYDISNNEFRLDPMSPFDPLVAPSNITTSNNSDDVLMTDLPDDIPPPEPQQQQQQQQQTEAVAQEKARARASKVVELAPPQWINMIRPGVFQIEEIATDANATRRTPKRIIFKDETPSHLMTSLTTTPTTTPGSTPPVSPNPTAPVLKRKRTVSRGSGEKGLVDGQQQQPQQQQPQRQRQPITPLMAVKRAMEMLQLEVAVRTFAERQLSEELGRASTLDHYRMAVQKFVAAAQFVSEGVRTAFERRLEAMAIINPTIWSIVGTLLANAHGDYSNFMALSAASTTFYNLFNSDSIWLFLLGRELYWDTNRVSDAEVGIVPLVTTDPTRDHMVRTYIMHHSAFLRMASGPYRYNNKPLELWRAAKRLVELRWRVRKAIMNKATEATTRKRISHVYAFTGTILGAIPTMVCMPESPWIFAVSANGVAMWQAGIRDLFVKMRFSQPFLGTDQAVMAPLRGRPVLEAMPAGATLLVGNFTVNPGSITRWWTHMRKLATETNSLQFFEAIVGKHGGGGTATAKNMQNLHTFHTAACVLPTIQMARTYETRFASMKETTHVLNTPLPASLKKMMDTEEGHLGMVYLYDRAILDLCVRATKNREWFGPGGAKYLWGTKDHTRLDPYAHQHIACSTGGGVVATVTPSLLLLAELDLNDVVVSSVHLSPFTDVLAATPPAVVKRQRAWPLFVILKRVFGLTISEPNIILVGVTFIIDSTTKEHLLTITARAPMADVNKGWLLSLTLSLHLLLESTTSLVTLISTARSGSHVIEDDRLGIIKNRHHSSTRGVAIVPEPPDNVDNNNNNNNNNDKDGKKTTPPPPTMGLKTFTTYPHVDELVHLLYSTISDHKEADKRWHFTPRLSTRGIRTPPSPPSFSSVHARRIDPDMTSDPRYRAAAHLRSLLQLRRAQKGNVAATTIFGAISDLWTTRDAVNWRMRYVVIEFGVLTLYFIEGRYLRVIGVPWSTAGSIHNYRIPLWSDHLDPRHYDRMAITCVHQGVVIVELMRITLDSNGKQRLVWSALVVRLTSFHPVNLFPNDMNKATSVPDTPLVSRRIASHADSKSVLPYGQPAEHEDMMASWTGL